mmetsp:Transcript_77219/g.239938  ORF Transcript_77219/g.239938 Transcript_77219/m.239938 type:complete len:279 (+) Transcript_77219:281-1117(+)
MVRGLRCEPQGKLPAAAESPADADGPHHLDHPLPSRLGPAAASGCGPTRAQRHDRPSAGGARAARAAPGVAAELHGPAPLLRRSRPHERGLRGSQPPGVAPWPAPPAQRGAEWHRPGRHRCARGGLGLREAAAPGHWGALPRCERHRRRRRPGDRCGARLWLDDPEALAAGQPHWRRRRAGHGGGHDHERRARGARPLGQRAERRRQIGPALRGQVQGLPRAGLSPRSLDPSGDAGCWQDASSPPRLDLAGAHGRQCARGTGRRGGPAGPPVPHLRPP